MISPPSLSSPTLTVVAAFSPPPSPSRHPSKRLYRPTLLVLSGIAAAQIRARPWPGMPSPRLNNSPRPGLIPSCFRIGWPRSAPPWRIPDSPLPESALLQTPRGASGDVKPEEAAEIRARIWLLGFNGKRGTLAPALLKKMNSEPWCNLPPGIWLWGSLDPAFSRPSPFDPRCYRAPDVWVSLLNGPGFCRISLVTRTLEWLWYRDGFDIAHEDKRVISRAARLGEELEDPGNHCLGQK